MKKLFNKIQNWFGSIPKDTHLHIEFTTLISYIVSKITQYGFAQDRYVGAAIGAIAAFGVGIAKEVCIDFFWRNEDIELRDLKNDLIGAATGAVMSLV